MKKRRVIFAYRAHLENQGSTIMRVGQLSRMLDTYQGERFEVECVPIPRPKFHRHHDEFVDHCADAVVIALKAGLAPLGMPRIESLVKRASAVCLDHVDSVPSDEDLSLYRMHLVASQTGRRKVEKRLRTLGIASSAIATVTHHADPRLPNPHRDTDIPLRLCYLGKIKNTILPVDESQVEVLTYEDQSFEKALDRLTLFPMHYAVRRQSYNPLVAKPFTKGFTAAAMRANVLVDAATDDAIYYLGTDYPYLIPDRTQSSIRLGLRKAFDDYGGPEWRRGLEIMEYVRQVSSPRHVVNELVAGIEMACDLGTLES